MEAFSERLLREHQPAWQAMQQHPFVTDIEQDRLPTVVFNRYLVFEGNFVATAIAIFALGVSKAPGIQQQRWLIGVLNALVDIQIAWFEQVLSARQIDPAEYPDDLPGAREQVPKDWPGIVLSDVCMPGCSGIDLMTLFHQDDDLLPILLITGHGDVPMAVEAVKKGAWDFLQKPIDPGKLLTLVDAALRQRQSVIARRQYCQQKLQVELIGRSQWTVRYRQRLQQLAETDIAVWLYGEPGTGRMTGARYLHQLGRHAEGPFIACELTPANAHTLNELIAQAQGGTLVLSHPEHLTHEQQHQLVQLQSHEKRPFRLIGIGSASLVELAASSQIVAELYYCFAMTQIGCQPLSKRPDDIEPLFHHYLQKTCQRLNHPVPEVDAGLLKGMMRRVWPNNVRELANAAELFAVGVLPLAETVNPLMHIGEPTPLDQRVEDVERQIITEALNIHQGRINEVAEYLLIPRKKLYLRMKKYGLNKEHYKGV